MQGYNENKQVEQRIQNEQVKGKMSTTKCNVAIRALAERWKKVSAIKERLPALHWDEGKGALGQNPIQLSFSVKDTFVFLESN